MSQMMQYVARKSRAYVTSNLKTQTLIPSIEYYCFKLGESLRLRCILHDG